MAAVERDKVLNQLTVHITTLSAKSPHLRDKCGDIDRRETAALKELEQRKAFFARRLASRIEELSKEAEQASKKSDTIDQDKQFSASLIGILYDKVDEHDGGAATKASDDNVTNRANADDNKSSSNTLKRKRKGKELANAANPPIPGPSTAKPSSDGKNDNALDELIDVTTVDDQQQQQQTSSSSSSSKSGDDGTNNDGDNDPLRYIKRTISFRPDWQIDDAWAMACTWISIPTLAEMEDSSPSMTQRRKKRTIVEAIEARRSSASKRKRAELRAVNLTPSIRSITTTTIGTLTNTSKRQPLTTFESRYQFRRNRNVENHLPIEIKNTKVSTSTKIVTILLTRFLGLPRLLGTTTTSTATTTAPQATAAKTPTSSSKTTTPLMSIELSSATTNESNNGAVKSGCTTAQSGPSGNGQGGGRGRGGNRGRRW